MSVFRYLGRRKRRPAIQRNNYLPTRLRIESLETRALVTSDLLTGLPLALYSTSGEADSTPAIVATDTVTGNAATKFLQFSLAVHDDQGNSFSSPLVAGQTFWLDVYINDTRQLSDAGAVTVQTDVSFTQGLASATGNFTPGDYPGPSSNRFNVVNSNTVFAQGQIPLSGSNLPTPPGPGPQLIDRIQMTAQSPGTVSFQTQFPNSDPGGLQTIFLADTNEAGGGSFGAADPATIAQGTTSATIVAAPNISIAGGAATTGAGATQITFTASTATAIAAPLTVHYQTVQTGTDNAVAGTDFTAVSNGTVVIAANTLSKDFSISIPNNTQFQGDKTFHVQLTSVDGGLGTITTAGGADSALGTIHYTKPTVSIADSSLTVSTSATTPMPFTVSLNTAAAVDVHVQYQAVTTGADTAVAGTDYVSSLSTVTILAGHTTADFNVTLNALSPGADKTFHVNLLGADNGTIADGSALATVINHVPSAPTVSVGAATSTTTSTTLNFPVTRSGDLSQPITLNYQTSLHQGDTAVAGTDSVSYTHLRAHET